MFTIDDIHRVLLCISKEFHLICEKNEIPYYMLGGTMLGAIRHKGFIPWDDDMDFGIPRPYFSKFINLCKTELPPSLKLIGYDNSDYAILGYQKLEDTTTVIEEIFQPKTEEKLGINIDIFPLDYANEKKSFFSKNSMYRTLFKLQKLLFVDPANRPQPQKILAIMAKAILPFSKTTIPRYLNSSLEKKNGQSLNMLCNYLGAWGLRELVPLRVFGEPTLYSFENTKFYGAQFSHEYLICLYGDDYMQLPPENKRKTHQVSVYSLLG